MPAIRPILQPRHVQDPYLALLRCRASLYAALEINAAAMRRSGLEPPWSSCAHLSLFFTVPGNVQGGRTAFPGLMDPTSPEFHNERQVLSLHVDPDTIACFCAFSGPAHQNHPTLLPQYSQLAY